MKNSLKNGLLASAMLLALSMANDALAQQNTTATGGANGAPATMIGKQPKAEFDRMSKKGAAAVAAVKATETPLSAADNKLMMQVAMGGMGQLKMGKIAVQKATNESVRALAQSEVEEQMGLSAKLKDIADAKSVTLPTTLDAETHTLISKMETASGSEFDKLYVEESGVNGHQKLDAVMTRVESNASDKSLKDLAKAAHPLVKTHLKVARDMMSAM